MSPLDFNSWVSAQAQLQKLKGNGHSHTKVAGIIHDY